MDLFVPILFALGTWRLVVGIRRYERQEILIADFLHRRAEGYPCSEILAEDDLYCVLQPAT